MIRAPVPRLPLLVCLLASLAACQPGATGPTGTPPPGSSGGPLATATFQPPTSFGPPPSPTPPDDSSPVVLDASLLAYLPESVGGFPVTESIDEAALALTDPALPQIATAIDAAVAVDTGGGNLVVAHVVKVRPERFSDDTYRQWRDSFDAGACSQSGGVVGNAEATIDARTVHITSCATAWRIYHVWLEDQDVLISASSIGEGRFGEELVDNLRIPS